MSESPTIMGLKTMNLEDILPEDWTTDGYGMSSNLVCPHGHVIEQDGNCPDGCISPLKQMGMI